MSPLDTVETINRLPTTPIYIYVLFLFFYYSFVYLYCWNDRVADARYGYQERYEIGKTESYLRLNISENKNKNRLTRRTLCVKGLDLKKKNQKNLYKYIIYKCSPKQSRQIWILTALDVLAKQRRNWKKKKIKIKVSHFKCVSVIRRIELIFTRRSLSYGTEKKKT